ncbi:MAG: hypothetical protein MJ185_08005 [Treponema sp.]|nr:hypothetical protein [Treponema sp.]
MKKLAVFLTVLFCFSGLFAAGKNNKINSTDVENGKSIKVTGIVKMYGNMPFSYAGIETNDGKKYSLVSGDPKLLKKVRDCAGREIKITGVVNRPVEDDVKAFQMLKDGYLYIESYEVIKNKKKSK